MAASNFIKPEKPFLLFYGEDEDAGWMWAKTEKDLRKLADELKEEGVSVREMMEIDCLRKII